MRSNDKSCALDVGVLGHGNIDLRARVLFESAFPDVGDYTDDAGRLVSRAFRRVFRLGPHPAIRGVRPLR